MFLALSRNLKRFEARARSPIYSHVHSSVQGLSTIRAFSAQTALRKEFDHYQDLHSSAFYMFMTCNRAFGFWLDMNCVFYTGAVITTVMLLETLAGDVGLSITQSINLIGVLQWGIRQWSELENQMISVERVVEYTKIPPEEEKREEETPKEWPLGGQITFESVTLQYHNSPHLALNDINLTIKSNEKIGIVGRTGAGKSSLISALFQLFKTEGKILIDNTDIARVPLNLLRSKLSIIPQEPILFNGTLRENLDPYHEQEDRVLYGVMGQVELKNLPLGLDHQIAERGSNLSVGQKQLVCLARAILRNNRILIMDEATASVDLETDFLIQKTIRENFQNCTILTVAHRLGTVLESDRVLVMDQGRIVEFDRVERLLRNPESFFSQLVKESGVQ